MKTIVYAPHVCNVILSEIFDPGCDYRSRVFAKILSKQIPKSKLILSRTQRAECDNNRKWCRNTPSRIRLRKEMETFRENFLVIEVHTFSDVEQYWRKNVAREPDIVILVVNNIIPSVKAYGVLSKEFDVDIIQASKTNDVQIEVKEYGGKGILLELNQRLSNPQIIRIGKILKFITYKKMVI